MVIVLDKSIPSGYRSCLKTANGDGNNEIDNIEAAIAVGNYCSEKQSESCLKFLDFLEKKGGYSFPNNRTLAIDYLTTEALKQIESRKTRSKGAKRLVALMKSDIPMFQKFFALNKITTKLSSKDEKEKLAAATALSYLAEAKLPREIRGLMVQPLVTALYDQTFDPVEERWVGPYADSYAMVTRSNIRYSLSRIARTDISIELKESMLQPLLDTMNTYTIRIDGMAAERDTGAKEVLDVLSITDKGALKGKVIDSLFATFKAKLASLNIRDDSFNALKIAPFGFYFNHLISRRVKLTKTQRENTVNALIGLLDSESGWLRSTTMNSLLFLYMGTGGITGGFTQEGPYGGGTWSLSYLSSSEKKQVRQAILSRLSKFEPYERKYIKQVFNPSKSEIRRILERE